MEDIKQASLKVRLATFGRLEKRYESEYGSQASTLAVAITNLLFSDVFPDDSPAKVLLETQENTIEKELLALQDDKELLTMIHVTLSQEIGIRYAYGSTAEQIEESFDRLKKYGLLVQTKGVSKEQFVYLANEFFDSNRIMCKLEKSSQKPHTTLFQGEWKPPPGSGFKTSRDFLAYLLRGLNDRK